MLKGNFTSSLLHRKWQPTWKTIMQHLSTESQYVRFLRMVITFKPWYGVRFRLQNRKEEMFMFIPRPSQCFWIYPMNSGQPLSSSVFWWPSQNWSETVFMICLTSSEYTTSCQSLEIGLMAGSAICPLAFTMVMNWSDVEAWKVQNRLHYQKKAQRQRFHIGRTAIVTFKNSGQ